MSLESIMREAEAPYRARIIEATFGHLNPKVGTRHKGHIVFAVSCYQSGSIIVKSEFDGLGSSPVMYDVDHSILNRPEADDAGVYRYDGELIRYKNGNARLLKGTIRKIV